MCVCVLEWKKEGGKLSTTASVWRVCRGGEDRVIPSLPVKCKVPSPPTGAGRGDPRVTGAELGPRRGLTPSGFPGSEVERAESERLEVGNRGAASAPPTVACPRWSRRCGVGVAAVRPRVPAPGGTSGAGDRRHLVRATAAGPSHCHHGDAVAPWPAEPAERPGRGARTRTGLVAAGPGAAVRELEGGAGADQPEELADPGPSITGALTSAG